MELSNKLTDHKLTAQDLYHYIKELDKENILTQDRRFDLAVSLHDFIERATLKFIKGQKEHGGNIEDRSMKDEIAQEVIDLFWYNEFTREV